MKRFKWVSRLSFFGGFLTYMGASLHGLQLLAALEKAMLATVVLYGLGIFSILAYFQVALHQKPATGDPASDALQAGTPPGHGTDAASWDGESAANGDSLQQ